ncbi:MAG: phytanoyl-CoA dioxygenase family protein [Actinobacteria bacterium]|nr:phytanoyl-CoA dioxygenase family protein [Actinomycetota bacterium]
MDEGSTMHDLNDTFEITANLRESFIEKGHCVVRGLASAEEIAHYKPSIDEATMQRRWDKRPLQERDTYGKAFIQSAAICQHNETTQAFIYARRFARVAAQLMGCQGVRLYHDQSLYKEPGGGFTPWHQDQVYWPLQTNQTVTMWMPLVDVPNEIGGMVFADGTSHEGNLGEEVIGDASQSYFDTLVEQRELNLSTHGPFVVGDATFHTGWTLHSAPANTTSTMRSVITIIYYADGTLIGETNHPARDLDLALWLGNAKPGTPADSPSNPLLWHSSWDE